MRPLAPDSGPLAFYSRNQRLILLLFWGLAAFLLSASLACADDFLRDPTRLQDGLRTTGWAPVIAGTAATVVTILVNGSVILQTSLGDDELEPGEEPTKWDLDITTENNRSTLYADGDDMLWIYAQVLCNKPAKRPGLVTKGIRFGVGGTHADWITLGRPTMSGGRKAIRIKAAPPTPDSELTDENFTILVTATIEGKSMTGPVELTLEPNEFIVEVSFEEVRP